MTPKLEARRALATTTLVLAAVLAPGLQHCQDRQRDSFPLSYYPMFSNARPDVEHAFYVLALGDGEPRRVSYSVWSTGGWTTGWRQLRAILKAGPEDARPFCEEIADRFAKDDDGWGARVSVIALVMGSYDLQTYFGDGDQQPLTENYLLTCPIPGRRP